MGKYCFTTAAIKIESIFIGSKISLQVKLYEAVIEPQSSGMKRLLARPKAHNSRVLEHQSTGSSAAPAVMLDDDVDESGSLVGSDTEEAPKVSEPVQAEKAPPKRQVKKVVRKAA